MLKDFTAQELIDFKALIVRLLDKWQGDVPLPHMEYGLCSLLKGYPEGRRGFPRVKSLSYSIIQVLLPGTFYISPEGQWSNERYEFLWLIAELSDKEWLELFV